MSALHGTCLVNCARQHTFALPAATIDKTNEIKENNDGKQTPVEACRIATMGRLTELGVVSWDINSDGKSEYEIADKELATSIKKL